MKIISKLTLVMLLSVFLISCNAKKSETLYILNIGDYINYDLLDRFEQENNVEVVITEVESNEAIYEQLKSNRTTFDVAFPSDYMIEQLEDENMLLDLDRTKIPNFKKENVSLSCLKYGSKSDKYLPYFNGTIGIMYNTKKIKNIKELVEKNSWKVLYDRSILKGGKVAMYNSSRDAFATAFMMNNKNFNSTKEEDIEEAYQLLKKSKFDMYGDDNLKKNVVTGNLDAALVYSGDYFEELSIATDEEKEINFSFYAPKTNNFWVDGIVIPKKSKNPELAHKFLNFMMDEDNALENAEYIGYPTAYSNVMKRLEENSDYDFLTKNKYYNLDNTKGLQMSTYKFFGVDYMMKLEELFSKSKSK